MLRVAANVRQCPNQPPPSDWAIISGTVSAPLDPKVIAPDNRLESWKDIAGYLNRNERTVRRWEQREGLPVYRLVHEKRGSVYAYRAELDAWRTTRTVGIAEAPAALGAGLSRETLADPRSAVNRTVRLTAAGAVLVVAALAVCAVIFLGPAFFVRAWLVREQPVFAPSPPAQLTRDSGLTTDPAISADGKLLAYASDRDGAGNLDIWVQHVSGGAARRLTTDPADDREPDISPEGNEVIFRSERDGGGIYSVPTLGGEPRLIIKGGYLPRFSPDGSRIAYSLGTFGSGGFEGNLYVYTIATGSTHLLAPDLTVAGSPAWTEDGKSLVFAGFEVLSAQPIYLFTCSADGGASDSDERAPHRGRPGAIWKTQGTFRGLVSRAGHRLRKAWGQLELMGGQCGARNGSIGR